MSVENELTAELHSRRFTDFDRRRIHRAQSQIYEHEITAYLVNSQIVGSSLVGVVFGHINKGPHGRYADGHFIRTSSLTELTKVGRFWVATTLNSRYVIASFRKENGRAVLLELLKNRKANAGFIH
ncbi:hypothetical protein [Pseudomonas abietaniphila]|uniref:Uncharacterized protein n=1 Tax=Pseudomonas abietaniphila TaxID=89065 RepID=A0A1G8SV14_9PSED|nr:hypothetical protein [Pseudomonas abietaniphila]SDJ33021.1 hypothetical protein SAMN05216605_12661 [Pseudomonas abietaniphila]